MLPVPLTPLLGRDREIDETFRLLGGTRLLTLTGAGGSGKTRLALELARRAKPEFPGGVAWIDLAPVSDPSLLGQVVLEALGLRDVQRDILSIIAEHLMQQRTLLVFDNCEHLVDACAALAERILRSCPITVILTTTREALGIPGEQTWLVPPLADPDAMRLFVERARAASPSFESDETLVSAICRRLDGIPLAIELAAARVKMFSVHEIAERLDDAFKLLSSGSRTLPRHRTIREAIDWSFRLLSVEEQEMLRRLSVFAGSFSLAAAEEVCGESVDTIAALVDKSLLQREPTPRETRYRLLETVRQFAAEKLTSSGEREELRDRHAHYFLDFLERAEPDLFGGAVDPPTLERVDAEIDNIRAFFEWASESPDRVELEQRAAWALHWYWFARGHFHEARQITGTAARRSGGTGLSRARALVAAGHAVIWQADWPALRDLIPEAVTLLRGHSDGKALAAALTLLGAMYAFTRDASEAAKIAWEEGVSIARKQGRNVPLTLALYWAGLGAELRGDLAAARTAFEEALAIGLEIDKKPSIGHPSTVLGHMALREHKVDEALEHFRRALDAHIAVDDRWGLLHTVEGVGLAVLEGGHAEAGIRLLAAASAAWLQLGARPGRDPGFELEKDRRLRDALTSDHLRVALASGAALKHEAMIALAQEWSGAPAKRDVLRVRALGPLEIESGGGRIGGGAASRDLLLFLLCNPGGRTKDQIGAALWPEADPARVRNNFHVTLHRLRKMLGDAEIIAVEDEKYSIKGQIDFDAVVFERSAREAIRAGDAPRIESALRLYGGDFLEEGDRPEWALPIRDRLRELFLEALQNLGRIRMAAADFMAAASVYERLIALDDADEQASRNLMRCLAKTGDLPGVTRVYRRLTEALRREVGAEPDPATTSLHKRIVSGVEA